MKQRLPGSSLVLTIVIALILSIFSSFLILLAYHNRLHFKTGEIEDRVNSNFESALNLTLTDTTIYQHAVTNSLDLFGENKDSVEINRSLWGIFEVASIKSFYGKFFKQENFFYGSDRNEDLNACLYLADHQRPLSLVGETKLIGDAYLSKAGLKTSYIDQRGFRSNKLIEGKLLVSDRFLPPLNEKVKNNLIQLLGKNIDKNQPTTSRDFPANDSLFNSFRDSTLIYVHNGDMVLANCILEGNILIVASGVITIESTAILKNIILVANGIVFDQGFHGKIQAISNDSLVVGNNCMFEYPSALILVKRQSELLQNRLVIKENCTINGLVFSICNNDDLYKSYIEIGENTIFNGLLYSMGYLNLRTDINGMVLTDFFIYKTPSTIYENHLVDREINRSNLSNYFLSSSLIDSKGEKGIIQWVK